MNPEFTNLYVNADNGSVYGQKGNQYAIHNNYRYDPQQRYLYVHDVNIVWTEIVAYQQNNSRMWPLYKQPNSQRLQNNVASNGFNNVAGNNGFNTGGGQGFAPVQNNNGFGASSTVTNPFNSTSNVTNTFGSNNNVAQQSSGFASNNGFGNTTVNNNNNSFGNSQQPQQQTQQPTTPQIIEKIVEKEVIEYVESSISDKTVNVNFEGEVMTQEEKMLYNVPDKGELKLNTKDGKEKFKILQHKSIFKLNESKLELVILDMVDKAFGNKITLQTAGCIYTPIALTEETKIIVSKIKDCKDVIELLKMIADLTPEDPLNKYLKDSAVRFVSLRYSKEKVSLEDSWDDKYRIISAFKQNPNVALTVLMNDWLREIQKVFEISTNVGHEEPKQIGNKYYYDFPSLFNIVVIDTSSDSYSVEFKQRVNDMKKNTRYVVENVEDRDFMDIMLRTKNNLTTISGIEKTVVVFTHNCSKIFEVGFMHEAFIEKDPMTGSKPTKLLMTDIS